MALQQESGHPLPHRPSVGFNWAPVQATGWPRGAVLRCRDDEIWRCRRGLAESAAQQCPQISGGIIMARAVVTSPTQRAARSARERAFHSRAPAAALLRAAYRHAHAGRRLQGLQPISRAGGAHAAAIRAAGLGCGLRGMPPTQRRAGRRPLPWIGGNSLCRHPLGPQVLASALAVWQLKPGGSEARRSIRSRTQPRLSALCSASTHPPKLQGSVSRCVRSPEPQDRVHLAAGNI